MVLISTAFLGIACAYYPYNSPVPDDQDLIFEVFSLAAVNCGDPYLPSTFTISDDRTIVMIATYHWCDGEYPGTISLQGEDGTVYGPWQAIGRDGSGGAANRYWEVDLSGGLNLPAGTYAIIDSRPETWSWTEDAGGRGISYVFALKKKSSGSGNSNGNGVVRGFISKSGDCGGDPFGQITGDCDEGIADVPVELTFTYVPPDYAEATPQTISATTDGNGKYKFGNVPPGSSFRVTANVKGMEKVQEGTMPDPVGDGVYLNFDYTCKGQLLGNTYYPCGYEGVQCSPECALYPI
jgi:hypothetical protein